ncbi:Fis family transcriptional regulator [Antrihabitans spumae]|uniref:Fis family transcriptional regulator n=1 Tax=Antrihabitans spumae TaxID=3373370 RepID=A0ABW7JHE9_9NOCA
MHEHSPMARFDETGSAVEIERLTLRDKDVAREAQRWTTGERGPVVEDPDQLANADLSEFVTEAVRIGVHALSVTGQALESRALERMLKDVGERAETAVTAASSATDRAVKEASATVARAADDAKKAITDADTAGRKELTTAIGAATSTVNAEVRRLFGGDNPELLDRLRPVLDKFATDLDAKVNTATSDLLAKAVKQFDVSDPTSPMAKHAAELSEHQRSLTEQMGKNHTDLTAKVDELTTALRVKEARASLAKVTPIKGDAYAAQLHTTLAAIAAGLGDEYTDTSTSVGAVSRSKKGDGLLSADGGAARVVVEMTDSARAGWAEYLDEAERNRLAGAALGLVRTMEQNGGQSIRTLGPRRIVLAFDPEVNDPGLLRTVLMLLRASALTANARTGARQIATAEEKITEAVAHLAKIDDVQKAAGAIQKSATKIESSCTAIHSGIHRLLSAALTALDGVDEDRVLADCSDVA